jgi:hypothetical protein
MFLARSNILRLYGMNPRKTTGQSSENALEHMISQRCCLGMCLYHFDGVDQVWVAKMLDVYNT